MAEPAAASRSAWSAADLVCLVFVGRAGLLAMARGARGCGFVGGAAYAEENGRNDCAVSNRGMKIV